MSYCHFIRPEPDTTGAVSLTNVHSSCQKVVIRLKTCLRLLAPLLHVMLVCNFKGTNTKTPSLARSPQHGVLSSFAKAHTHKPQFGQESSAWRRLLIFRSQKINLVICSSQNCCWSGVFIHFCSLNSCCWSR